MDTRDGMGSNKMARCGLSDCCPSIPLYTLQPTIHYEFVEWIRKGTHFTRQADLSSKGRRTCGLGVLQSSWTYGAVARQGGWWWDSERWWREAHRYEIPRNYEILAFITPWDRCLRWQRDFINFTPPLVKASDARVFQYNCYGSFVSWTNINSRCWYNATNDIILQGVCTWTRATHMRLT